MNKIIQDELTRFREERQRLDENRNHSHGPVSDNAGAISQEPKITRVDMKQYPNGVSVLQYPDGWTAGTNPVESHMNTTTPLDEMVEWFVGRGWIVRTWPGGARAWFGKVMPIRSKREILRMRSELNKGLYWTRGVRPDNLQLNALDLSVDL